jgi:glutathione S-transferase
VHDSTRIVSYLDETYSDKPVLPADPGARARAKLLEEWSDEGLRSVTQPVRWLIPRNFERSATLFRSGYPPGAADDLAFRGIAQFIRLDCARRFGPRVGFGKASRYLNRLAEVLDYLEGCIGGDGWLVEGGPTVADFAVAGWITTLRGLDGWETVKVRRKTTKLAKTLIPDRDESVSEEGKKNAIPAKDKEAFDAETQAIIDASRLRRASKGQI